MRRAVSGRPDVLDCAPHFERMLYDNAQLSRVYLHAWQVTTNEFSPTITEEILDYVAREMLDDSGGFYSTQDADSEGEEGKFFVWTPDQIRQVLGKEADAFMAAYGVTRHGDFEGKNILEFVGDMDQRPALAEARSKLFEAREKRVHPGRDDVLTSWNGLMLAAFAESARALDRDDYRVVAERNGGCLLHELRQEKGSPVRTWRAGEVKLSGYLEDYSYLIDGLLELYKVGDPKAADTQALLSVVRDGYQPFRVVALGAPDGLQLAQARQLPSNAADRVGCIAAVPLLLDRGLLDGQAAAYVCRDFSCQAPLTEPVQTMPLWPVSRSKVAMILPTRISGDHEIAKVDL
jgi:uncharacterized protein YyaL (SSP411 family)